MVDDNELWGILHLVACVVVVVAWWKTRSEALRKRV